jgi:hypothetical protein
MLLPSSSREGEGPLEIVVPKGRPPTWWIRPPSIPKGVGMWHAKVIRRSSHLGHDLKYALTPIDTSVLML